MRASFSIFTSLLLLPLSTAFAEDASSSKPFPLSYTIINSTSGATSSITISNLVKKTLYTCDTNTVTCIVSSTIPVTYVASSTHLVTLEEAKTILASSTTNTRTDDETGTYSLPTEVPKDASFVTTSKQGAYTAFYTTTGSYGIKKSRIYWLRNNINGEVRYFIEPIHSGWDLVSDFSNVFSFSDDEKSLVYVSDRDSYMHPYVIDLSKTWNKDTSLEGTALITKKYSIIDFIVKNHTLFFIAGKDNPYIYNLYSYNLSQQEKVHTISSSVFYTNALLLSGDSVLFTRDIGGIGKLFLYNTVSKEVKEFSGLDYGTIKNTSGKPLTTPVKGVLVPGDKKTKQALIWLHGGPYRQTAINRHSYGSYALYDWMLQGLRDQGVTILKLDYPGSANFGSNYATSLVGNIGTKDVESVKKAISYLKKSGYTSITIAGVSYGGYLSLKSAVDMPSSFKSVISIAPVTDWNKLVSDVKPTPFEVHFAGIPDETNKKLYQKADILSHVSTKTPKLSLIQGDKDDLVPYTQSLYFLEQTKTKNPDVNISLLSLSNEKHVLRGPAQIEQVCRVLFTETQKDASYCDLKQ